MSARVASPDEVLAYWFPQGHDATTESLRARMDFWFHGGAAVDAEIRARFGATLEAAVRGELSDWSERVRGRLALVIVLDQFPRNMFRGTPQAFAQDARALEVAQAAVAAGDEAALGVTEQMFLRLPFAHSERAEMQEQSVRAVERIASTAPASLRPMLETGIARARARRAAVQKFGRIPERNATLGRASTAEETAYLAQTI